MSESNKAEAQTELRKVIADAFAAQTLWTTDWAGVQLQRFCIAIRFLALSYLLMSSTSLVAKPTVTPTLKRKMYVVRPYLDHGTHSTSLRSVDSPISVPTGKKTKKAAKVAASASAPDLNDIATLNRRAQRFQREHDLERQKSLKANHQNSHLFNNQPLTRTLSPYNSADDPDADPVR